MNSLRMSFWIVPESFCGRHALFLRRDDVEREHRQHRAVHGHRHAHPVERNAGEQGAHVVDGIDGDTRHAHIARDARMVGIVAAMGGEVEGDRETLLAGGEVAAVEGVRILGRGEPGILAHGPGLVDVHGGVGTAQIRRDARIGVEEVEPGAVLGLIGSLDGNPLRRQPGLGLLRRGGCRGGIGEGDARKVGNAGHGLGTGALDG